MKEGGRLDASDQEMLREMSQNGQLQIRVLNIREMLEIMESTKPKKFEEFKEGQEKKAGRRLTFDELVDLSRKADNRAQEFTGLVKDLTRAQAAKVRNWRVDEHMTWRRLAREAYLMGWFSRSWQPPENQIMGMALCEKAAPFFKENFREPPWN